MSVTPSTLFVSTLVKTDAGFLMIQEGKNNYGQRGKWNFPAGHVELGETLMESATREVKEETGYDVRLDGLVTIQKKDFADEMGVVVFFAGSLLGDRSSANEEHIMNVKFVPIKEMASLDLRFPDLLAVAKRVEAGEIYSLGIIEQMNEVKRDAK